MLCTGMIGTIGTITSDKRLGQETTAVGVSFEKASDAR